MKIIRKMAKRLITQQPTGAVHFRVIYPWMITSNITSSIQPSHRSNLGYTTHFQVSLIVHDTFKVHNNIFLLTEILALSIVHSIKIKKEVTG